MTRFAAATSVPVERSRADIERLITRYGATSTAYMQGADKAMILFEAKGRRIMFELPLPRKDDKRFTHYRAGGGCTLRARAPDAARKAWEQGCRSAWRALGLIVKAKFEAIESKITTFEDEFLAHIVMPDGQTVGQHVRPQIAAMYSTGKMQPLLPSPKQASP